MTHLEAIARETGISLSSVSATAKLIAEGGTVPFISRYRKEQPVRSTKSRSPRSATACSNSPSSIPAAPPS